MNADGLTADAVLTAAIVVGVLVIGFAVTLVLGGRPPHDDPPEPDPLDRFGT